MDSDVRKSHPSIVHSYGENSFLVQNVPDLSKLRGSSKTGMEFEILKSGSDAIVSFAPCEAHHEVELTYDHEVIGTGQIMVTPEGTYDVEPDQAVAIREPVSVHDAPSGERQLVVSRNAADQQVVSVDGMLRATIPLVSHEEGQLVLKGVEDLTQLCVDSTLPVKVAVVPGEKGLDVHLMMDPGVESHKLFVSYQGRSLFPEQGYALVEKRPKVTFGPEPKSFSVAPIQQPGDLSVKVTNARCAEKSFDQATNKVTISLPDLDRTAQVDIEYRGLDLAQFAVAPKSPAATPPLLEYAPPLLEYAPPLRVHVPTEAEAPMEAEADNDSEGWELIKAAPTQRVKYAPSSRVMQQGARLPAPKLVPFSRASQPVIEYREPQRGFAQETAAAPYLVPLESDAGEEMAAEDPATRVYPMLTKPTGNARPTARSTATITGTVLRVHRPETEVAFAH
eukprot:492440_1